MTDSQKNLLSLKF